MSSGSLRDIAKLANVSTATVSRVMSGSVGVSPEKRQAVLQAVEALGLETDELRKGRKVPNLALVTRRIPGVPDYFTSNIFYSQVLRGIECEVARNKCNLLLVSVDEDEIANGKFPQLLRTGSADGIIVGGYIKPEAMVRLLDCNLPVVLLDNYHENQTYCVISDNVGGARQAVKHLAATTNGDIHMFCGPLSDHSFSERMVGYKCALVESGRRVNDADIHFTEAPGLIGGYELAAQVLKEGVPGGIFCSNDEIAIGLLRWLNEQNIRVPEDVAVAGFDDLEMSAHVHPTLTTVHTHKEYMGAVAVQRLMDLIRNGAQHPEVSLVSTHLVVRGSTRPDREESLDGV